MRKQIKAWFKTNEEDIYFGEALFKNKESAKKYYFDLKMPNKTFLKPIQFKISLTLFSLGITCLSFATVFSFMPTHI
ncbi:MAG: hypothetical protein H6579_01375 [Chitinophagales bacterium]|nr:hypothetical protein [Chitinophagales bacterium]